jgi:hypothetical protein
MLLAIWREVLDADELGPDDDFFAWGGHSLLVVEAVARAEERGLSCEFADVFLHPTASELALVIDRQG